MRPDELTPSQLSELLTSFEDHERFCLESLRIRDLGGNSVPMELGAGQRKLHAAIAKQRKQGKPVRLVVLKTRRSWFTAGSCGEAFHLIPFFPGRKGLVIADKYNPAGMEAFGYLTHFQKTYKPFTVHDCAIKLPKLVKDAEQRIAWENESSIDVLSAEGGDVGRGGGRHFLLCDEMAFWRAPEVTLTAVLNMVPKIADTTVIVQSTANGVGGEFYELWMRASDPAQASGWATLFFGWLEHEKYRLPVDNPAEFQRSLDPEERMLHEMHGATLEQLNWRRMTIATECRGKVDLFHQEYPTTPEEAFLSSGRPALDHAALSRMAPSEPAMVGDIREIDEYGGKRVIIQTQERGAVQIWRRPEKGRLYVMGSDPARGIDVSEAQRGDDPDWSVSIVLDAAGGEQVAMVRERLRPAEFARLNFLLGRWYNWAFATPESNAHGLGHLEEMIRLGYPVERIYRRQRDPSDRRANRVEELGFETTEITRPWLISALDSALREQAITLHSAIALQECRTFVIKPNGKMEHQNGCHDDCVIALALAVMGLRQAPRKAPSVPSGGRSRPYAFYGTGKRRTDDED